MAKRKKGWPPAALCLGRRWAPVSMATWSGATPAGMRVSFVYTPPELRSRGYASACVTALSRLLLQRVSEFCGLFTDLAHPASNRIYRRIVCDFTEYRFS